MKKIKVNKWWDSSEESALWQDRIPCEDEAIDEVGYCEAPKRYEIAENFELSKYAIAADLLTDDPVFL